MNNDNKEHVNVRKPLLHLRDVQLTDEPGFKAAVDTDDLLSFIRQNEPVWAGRSRQRLMQMNNNVRHLQLKVKEQARNNRKLELEKQDLIKEKNGLAKDNEKLRDNLEAMKNLQTDLFALHHTCSVLMDLVVVSPPVCLGAEGREVQWKAFMGRNQAILQKVKDKLQPSLPQGLSWEYVMRCVMKRYLQERVGVEDCDSSERSDG